MKVFGTAHFQTLDGDAKFVRGLVEGRERMGPNGVIWIPHTRATRVADGTSSSLVAATTREFARPVGRYGLITVYALEPHPNWRRTLARSDRRDCGAQFLAHRPVLVFANAWTSDRSGALLGQ